MSSLLDYYRLKNLDENNCVTFEKVKEEDIKICGKTISEVINILKGLELERATGIEMTMEHLQDYIEFFHKEQEEMFNKTLERTENGFSAKIKL